MKARLMKALRKESGVAAVEFAIVSVLLLSLFWGLISFGFVFGTQHDLTHAASEGARAALRAPAGQEVAYAEDQARNSLTIGSTKDHAVITADIVDPCDAQTPPARCIHVHVAFDYHTYPVVPPLFGIGAPASLTADSTLVLD